MHSNRVAYPHKFTFSGIYSYIYDTIVIYLKMGNEFKLICSHLLLDHRILQLLNICYLTNVFGSLLSFSICSATIEMRLLTPKKIGSFNDEALRLQFRFCFFFLLFILVKRMNNFCHVCKIIETMSFGLTC